MKGAKNLNLTIFEANLFNGPPAKASPFIRAMHPKASILPKPDSIMRILASGWVGQMKVDGHRAQIHFSADPREKMIAYNRHGQPHQKLLPVKIVKEIRRVFAPKEGWSVIDAEWVKPCNRLYVFDYLKRDGIIQRDFTYAQRYALLPRDYLSPHLITLPIYQTIERCIEILEKEDALCEGLVLKAFNTIGFSDTSIIRCRRQI